MNQREKMYKKIFLLCNFTIVGFSAVSSYSMEMAKNALLKVVTNPELTIFVGSTALIRFCKLAENYYQMENIDGYDLIPDQETIVTSLVLTALARLPMPYMPNKLSASFSLKLLSYWLGFSAVAGLTSYHITDKFARKNKLNNLHLEECDSMEYGLEVFGLASSVGCLAAIPLAMLCKRIAG